METTSIRTTWGGEPAFQVIARDISERRAAEAADRYRASLVAHVSDAIIGIDAEGKIESWNEAARAIYGWTEEEVVGLSIAAVVTSNRTDSAAVLERGQRSHRRKDGSEVDVLVSIDPLIDDDTQPSGWVVVCTELTDARQAEAGRRAAEERYEAVVASLSEGIVLFDENGNVSAHNEAAARILGEPPQLGLQPPDLHRLLDRHRGQRSPDVRRFVPPRGDARHRRLPGRSGHRRHRRKWPAPVALAQLTPALGCGPERVAHGGLLVHRRHRPKGRRSPAPLARLPRLPHRPGQPLAVQRRTRARAVGVHATGHQPGRALHRPRPVQAGQRLLRPRQRRRGAAGPGPAVQVGRPGRGRGQSLLRRRVRRAVPQRPRRRGGHRAWPPSTRGCCPIRSSSPPAATWW